MLRKRTNVFKARPQVGLALMGLIVFMLMNIRVYGEPMVGGGAANVHKFHPNGRYGRSSLSPGADSSTHSELAQEKPYRMSEGSGVLRNLLTGSNNLVRSPFTTKQSSGISFNEPQISNGNPEKIDALMNDMELGSMQQEMNKLLKCDYTGSSNLYWCNL